MKKSSPPLAANVLLLAGILLVLLMLPAMARAAESGQAGSLATACVTLLKDGQPRVRCVLSSDHAIEKQPVTSGSAVSWDRVISDPLILQTLKSHAA